MYAKLQRASSKCKDSIMADVYSIAVGTLQHVADEYNYNTLNSVLYQYRLLNTCHACFKLNNALCAACLHKATWETQWRGV